MSQTPTAGPRGNSSSNPVSPSIGDPLADPAVLSAQAAAEARRIAVRTLVLPMLIGMVHTSSSTRAKLWASNGLDLFLQLMATEVSRHQSDSASLRLTLFHGVLPCQCACMWYEHWRQVLLYADVVVNDWQ